VGVRRLSGNADSDDGAGLSTRDCAGLTVRVGMVVRVLALPEGLLGMLDPHERARVASLLGQALAVIDVDEWGKAWVEQWWPEGDGDCSSHSLALEPDAMAVCPAGTVPDGPTV